MSNGWCCRRLHPRCCDDVEAAFEFVIVDDPPSGLLVVVIKDGDGTNAHDDLPPPIIAARDITKAVVAYINRIVATR
jgi:hypothetical protein